jgi:hypothetical protein
LKLLDALGRWLDVSALKMIRETWPECSLCPKLATVTDQLTHQPVCDLCVEQHGLPTEALPEAAPTKVRQIRDEILYGVSTDD